jgi:SAM-dependent methyltransferase
MKEDLKTMAAKEKDAFFDHFNWNKPTKFGTWLVRTTAKRVFEFSLISQNSSILEIGAGRGVFADICLENGLEYWAIEPNVKMAKLLEARKIKVLRNIVPPIPETGRNFDAVVMINVLEHMNTMTAALELAKQVYKLLNPRGKFVIYVPDYVNWRYHFFLSDFSHNYITTWRRMQGLLISAGFEKVEGKYLSGPFGDLTCLLISAMASWLPFGQLSATFPKSKLLRKLYNLQTPFLRRVLMRGEKLG